MISIVERSIARRPRKSLTMTSSESPRRCICHHHRNTPLKYHNINRYKDLPRCSRTGAKYCYLVASDCTDLRLSHQHTSPRHNHRCPRRTPQKCPHPHMLLGTELRRLKILVHLDKRITVMLNAHYRKQLCNVDHRCWREQNSLVTYDETITDCLAKSWHLPLSK